MDPDVQCWVEEQLALPKPPNALSLYVKARETFPAVVEGLSWARFNATYPLQIRKRRNRQQQKVAPRTAPLDELALAELLCGHMREVLLAFLCADEAGRALFISETLPLLAKVTAREVLKQSR